MITVISGAIQSPRSHSLVTALSSTRSAPYTFCAFAAVCTRTCHRAPVERRDFLVVRVLLRHCLLVEAPARVETEELVARLLALVLARLGHAFSTGAHHRWLCGSGSHRRRRGPCCRRGALELLRLKSNLCAVDAVSLALARADAARRGIAMRGWPVPTRASRRAREKEDGPRVEVPELRCDAWYAFTSLESCRWL